MKSYKAIYLCAIVFALLTACDNQVNTPTHNTPSVSKSASTTQHEIVMYKSPTCACCTGWAEHLRQSGFQVTEKKSDDMMAVKKEYGVPDKLSSCHTAIIGGYIIEGHVPAQDVERLLKERPQIAGLTAPGMPMKSPGMQPQGLPAKGYDVLAFNKDGSSKVFTRY